MEWSEAENELADLIAQFGRPTRTGRRQSAAYPFTRLRADHVWVLDRDVPMDNVGSLDQAPVTGRLEPTLERELKAPGALQAAARVLVESQFPPTVAPDVLQAVGLDPEAILSTSTGRTAVAAGRQRSAAWRAGVLRAWDHRCAFCGYDGRLGQAPVGLEAAHVRWFNFDGPDELDNGLALCALHHKLLDRGAMGLDDAYSIVVSDRFSAGPGTAQLVYDLHGTPLRPRPGTVLPASAHVAWHRTEVFQGDALPA